ncbi:MAG: hypothetical protein ACRC5A_08540, partial [Enterobacteriaceae bacterium]
NRAFRLSRRVVNCIGAVVVLVVLANDHLIMITAHFPLFFLKIRHFFYRYQLVDPKDPTYNWLLSKINN